MNTTNPIYDNGDDSFDWQPVEDWQPTTPEEMEAALPDIHAEQNGGDMDWWEFQTSCYPEGDSEEQMYPRDHEDLYPEFDE